MARENQGDSRRERSVSETVRPSLGRNMATPQHSSSCEEFETWCFGGGKIIVSNSKFDSQEVCVFLFKMPTFFAITQTHTATRLYSYAQPNAPMRHTYIPKHGAVPVCFFVNFKRLFGSYIMRLECCWWSNM